MKVLVADDCSTTLEILRLNLSKWGYEPMLVSDGEKALRILKSPAGPRLALLDWNMPKLDGVSVCRELRSRTQNALNYTYIIMLTAREGEEHMVEALEAGADEFLIKPAGTRELQLRVRTGERIIELQERVVRMNRQLALITTHDRLTGLLNRQTLMERFTQEIERSSRISSSVSYISVDVDQLEQINNRFGLSVGDEILQQIAQRMQKSIRTYDAVGRVGGEEFAIVLPDTRLGMAAAMAERLRNSICGYGFLAGDQEIQVSLSLGVSSSSAEGSDRKRILSCSEKALEFAKSKGGDRVIMCEAGVIMDPLTGEKIGTRQTGAMQPQKKSPPKNKWMSSLFELVGSRK